MSIVAARVAGTANPDSFLTKKYVAQQDATPNTTIGNRRPIPVLPKSAKEGLAR